MKKKLEEFIKENRHAFDDKEPSEKIWHNVEASLPTKKHTLWSAVNLWRAAAIFFMGLSIYLLLPKSNATTSTNNTIAQQETLQEFKDVEHFYVQQISDKVKLIDEFEKMEGLNGFTQDFHQLEAMYSVLKEEMTVRPSKKVKDALVLNLLVRIDLLNQQLHKLEKGEYDEDKKNNEISS